jgi:hypothetical protein
MAISDANNDLRVDRNSNAGGTPCTTLIGVFDDRLEAERAVDELEAMGFRHDQVGYAIRGSDAVRGGMITDTAGAKDGKGAAVGAVTGAATGGILAAAVTALLPGAGPILAAGMLAMFAGYAGAGAAIGGILGAMTGLGVSEDEAKYYEKAFNEGKAIVAVQPGTRGTEAGEILRRHGGYDLQTRTQSPVETRGFLSEP